MTSRPSTSRQNVSCLEEEVFEDSTILANFNNSSFRDSASKFSESNANDSLNRSGLNVSALCCDEELSGYDKLTGQTWVYPTNYPKRDYQFNIIQAAILKNTLVSLPTGLGKTFIAAVIMYNFYRWYPLGKIVFTAPTRPLVAQQISACYDIVAIPPEDTIEMTGHMAASTRKTQWQTKRVFFATPQVIANDIKSGICPADRIRCLVIDEAHRARGNYAYCHIISTLTDMGCKTYRVLALSATPGSKVEDVVNVVKNLHIAHLELRTESCIDVAPYSHARSINTVLVPLGPELSQLRNHYIEILDTYARRLKQLNILPHNLGNLSKGRVVMMYKEFQNKEHGLRHPQHNYIMKDFTLLIALFHGLELLIRHGSRVFLNFFDEHPEKSWIQADDRLTALLERLRDDLGVNPMALNLGMLPDGSFPEIPKNISFGHPKFYKLKEIMLEHFKKAKEEKRDTRAIVFCEYRESVNLVHCLLLQCAPLIKAQIFVGKGASGTHKSLPGAKSVVSQKQQSVALRDFRSGARNTLVATCVAEEGLDVGSVDLIVCFDVATRSPVRLVQRCGRTGRERGGKVYILVTEGREHQTLQDCMRQRDGLNKKIQLSREVQASLYEGNPRLIPHGFTPRCQHMFITVRKHAVRENSEKNNKSQKDLRTMLLGRASSSGSNSSNNIDLPLLTEEEFQDLYPEGFHSTNLFEEPVELSAMSRDMINSYARREGKSVNLSTWLEWQRTEQKTINIGHSKDTEILSSLLQYSDAKRFELPASTQNPSFNTQDFASQKIIPSPSKTINKVVNPTKSPVKTKQNKKKQRIPLTKSPVKKDGDIRALFSTATKSTKSYTKLISELGIQNDGSISTGLLNLLVDLSLNNHNNNAKTCYICANICDCAVIKGLKTNRSKPAGLITFLKEPKLPNIDLIDDLNAETILKCAKNDISLLKSQELDETHSQLEQNCSKNFELEFDFDSPIDLTSPENLGIDNDDAKENSGHEVKDDENFDIGDIEDIFADSSPEEVVTKAKDKNSSDPKEALGFFGLDSIDDIFADSDDSANNNIPNTPEKVKESSKLSITTSVNLQNSLNSSMIQKAKATDVKPIQNNVFNSKPESLPKERSSSPSILSGKANIALTSPILCSQVRKFKLSTKKNQLQSSTPNSNVKRCLISEIDKVKDDSVNTKENSAKKNSTVSNAGDKTKIEISQNNTNNKSMFTITQLVDMINKTEEKSILSKSNTRDEKQINFDDEERSTSPIFLTQIDKKKASTSNTNANASKKTGIEKRKSESLIILESSDSENESTQIYDADEKLNETEKQNDSKIALSLTSFEKHNMNQSSVYISAVSSKREISLEGNAITESPFFNKQKKVEQSNKKLTLQQKVLAALTSNKLVKKFPDDNHDTKSNISFMMSPTKPYLKENLSPESTKCSPNKDEKEEYMRKNNLKMLQMFRRDSKVTSPRSKFESLLSPRQNSSQNKRKLTFDDSDDDFVDAKTKKSQNAVNGYHEKEIITNHKVRKKKRKPANDLLDLEADLSSDHSDSGDELSDDSVGSIADFICDENVTHHEDMQAHYMRSVKSPVNGKFKIPELPKRLLQEEVFSQFVEEDNYEMDSFCVDSHIGLTQANDVSDLEVAEMLLEERRGKKKRRRNSVENDESPIMRQKKRARRIQSDSEDSS